MCGVFGSVAMPSDASAVLRALAHRGPDDSGFAATTTRAGSPVVLASTRLAIRDLSIAGHMPMRSDDGSVVLSYNGELYNDGELRKWLASRGVSFRSTSDTETVLRMYQELGLDFIGELDGMFALCLWDAREERMVVARDAFGVKPLYYKTSSDGGFACASEVKALLSIPGTNAEVDPVALQQYLTFLWVPDPRTMFRGISKLEAGHIGVFQNGSFTDREYWDLEFPPVDHAFTSDEDELVERFRELFDDSVRRQMVSDVPIGAFLSAGLDSSSIVASMARQSAQPVRTFTIRFPSDRRTATLDNTAVAERTAAHFGCIHTSIDVEPDVVDLLPRLVWHLDEPIADPAAITAYLVNRAARAQATVVMSGVGGDELLAGYRKHAAQQMAARYRKLPSGLRQSVIAPLVERLPAMHGSRFSGHVRLAKKWVQSASLASDDMFLMNSTYFDAPARQRLMDRRSWADVADADPLRRHREHFARVGGIHPLNRMLYVDTKAFMVSLNLTYNDKASMAVPTEVRVPFLDRTLAEFMATEVPPYLKLHGGFRPTTKHLLRKAMKGTLPDEVLSQPKAGFGAPVARWLNQDLAPMIDDLLSPEQVKRRGWFDPNEVASVLNRHRSGRTDMSLQIWALLTFELWNQQFVDAPSALWPSDG